MWPIRRVEFFGLGLRIIFDHHFEGTQNSKHTRRACVEVFAHSVFEKREINRGEILCDADLCAKFANRICRVSATPKPSECGHAWIVPAGDELTFHEFKKLALAHHGVRKVEARKLGLSWDVRHFRRFNDPIVKSSRAFEFHRANRVRDPLE